MAEALPPSPPPRRPAAGSSGVTRVSPADLAAMQATPQQVRNICILAHVDHGKTTLSDSLIASNGIISKKLAGKLRFLDSTEEEQRRKITMEASVISLVHQKAQGQGFLVNLIDSPGHVDFSSDVSTAVRLCDGALVVVDVVEGVCTQTQAVLRQAWEERLRPCLVLNKIDRLIKELQLTPSEAYDHLQRVVEQVNAITSSFVTAAAMEDSSSSSSSASQGGDGASISTEDWQLDIDDDVEASMTFAPERGNVVFASAHDCWAFRLETFARLWARKLPDVPPRQLRRALWGEYYFQRKTGKIVKTPPRASANPMFVDMIIAPIWEAYNALVVEPDHAKAVRIVRGLGLDVPEREFAEAADPQAALHAVMSRWLPLSRAVLNMVVEKVPSPVAAQALRVDRIWPALDGAGEASQAVRAAVAACDSSPEAPVVAFVSKMYCVADGRLMGFARVFSGVLRAGAPVYVLGPKYAVADGEGSEHLALAPEGSLGVNLVMGRDFFPLSEAPAGNVVAVSGLDNLVLKTATLASTPACPALLALSFQSRPIVKVAVSTTPAQMPLLKQGLQLLFKADPCVEVTVNDLGEWLVSALGEMHLEHCVKELRERFARCDITVSPPIVSFRETVVQTSEDAEPTWTPSRQVSLSVRAIPLSAAANEVLERVGETLRDFSLTEEPSAEMRAALEEFCAVAEIHPDRVWAFGPHRTGANALIAAEGVSAEADERLLALRPGIISGFQMTASAGPLADEPLTGVCFALTGLEWHEPDNASEEGGEEVVSHGPLSGQIISAMRSACRRSVVKGAARLVQALYLCEVQCDAEMLGRLYAVINRRRGRVLDESMWEGTAIFNIKALLPVVESFGFSDELRERTSGAGTSPQLVFSHWETIEADPFFQPTTTEEREDLGEEMNVTNFARDYVDQVRRRKGLQVETKIVQHADKQRTLARKK